MFRIPFFLFGKNIERVRILYSFVSTFLTPNSRFLVMMHYQAEADFVAGTIVKTRLGGVSIENLVVGDTVLSHENDGNYAEYQITHIITRSVEHYVKVVIGGECICTDFEQKFYLPQEHMWLTASELNDSHALLGCNNVYVPIDSVEVVGLPTTVYALSVDTSHTFCVSPLGIKVHNFAPVVIIGLSWAFGCGAAEFTGVVLG
jgi:hypothetical protein